MRIIGVIDLKDGQAVHARAGKRDTYAPVVQAAGIPVNGRAADLARVYVDVFKLEELYIADLNAISGMTAHLNVVRSLGAVGATMMVDAGIRTAQEARHIVDAGAETIVVGLETLPSMDALAGICRGGAHPVAFSLDLRAGSPMTDGRDLGRSPEEIASHAAKAGASAVIVLDVARVGTGTGPDIAMLQRIRRAVPDRPVLAGGGVSGLDDLRRLAALGCDGALLATALHDGRLTPADIAAARDLQRSGRREPERHNVSR